MSGSGIHLSEEGPVVHIRIAAPPLNHLSASLLEELAGRLELLDNEPSCRTVLLSTEGRVFCAGADFGKGPPQEADVMSFYGHAMRLFRTRKPIVAAVQGASIGAGMGLALAADFRVAAHSAWFSANFNRLGIHPGFGMSVTLPRLVGVQFATKLFYTACRIDGVEAGCRGLVDEVVDDAGLLQGALNLAREIAASAPDAVQSTRAALRGNLADAVQDANRHECAVQLMQFRSRDFREGVAASLERRTPSFAGH